jgi:hypothetical protein
MLLECGVLCRAPNRLRAEPSVSEGGNIGQEMADKFCLGPNFRVVIRVLLHAVHLQHGSNGFTFLSKEGMLRIFTHEQNPPASAGFEPTNSYDRPEC